MRVIIPFIQKLFSLDCLNDSDRIYRMCVILAQDSHGFEMRDEWNRATDEIQLSNEQVEQILSPVFSSKVASVEKAQGGLANTNLKIRLVGDEQTYLLRFCVREPESAAREVALLELVAAKVSVPRITCWSTDNQVTGHPFILMHWVDGQRLESVYAELNAREIEEIGESLGLTLAAIHSFKFEGSGFFDQSLSIPKPIEMGGGGLRSYVEDCCSMQIVRERLGDNLTEKLRIFVNDQSAILDEWHEKPCLTHCDFNGSNILVNKSAGFWSVSSVLDWEFAFSGTPFFDFGNLLRPPFGELSGLEAAIERGYTRAGGYLTCEWKRMSKLTDLTAWLDFMTREKAGAALISDARKLCLETIENW